jgi:hypothetical protein
MVADEISPTAFRRAEPPRRNENPRYDLEVVLARLI